MEAAQRQFSGRRRRVLVKFWKRRGWQSLVGAHSSSDARCVWRMLGFEALREFEGVDRVHLIGVFRCSTVHCRWVTSRLVGFRKGFLGNNWMLLGW